MNSQLPLNLQVVGIPGNTPPELEIISRTRLVNVAQKLIKEMGLDTINLYVGNPSNLSSGNDKSSTSFSFVNKKKDERDSSTEDRSDRYKPTNPIFDFDRLIVPEKVKDDLLLAIDLIDLEFKVFDTWNLRSIEPFPRTSLNFYGPPGTGKTLAAHAIASKVNRKILVASYAQIESMYHGEGPKNVEAIFMAAERENAVLFIDEADSLLSKRLTNVTQGSEQAINSMRSQLLICLEKFKGIVIFATNLVENYDKAFETRVRNIHFPMPDRDCRREIWRRHIPDRMPIAENVDTMTATLADVEDVCGRDIRNALIDAALRAARKGKEYIETSDIVSSIERIKESRITVKKEFRKPSTEAEEDLAKKLNESLKGIKL
ncbi:ATP-binding protein [Chamaesiphon sp. VAR_48_metabat_135_sub]|uniref:ATP-binding protein n=1 Tax=Chamaesiphon sp. VAR_48_metabat_135_sub TaxID=2964699 RepID=UPI00286A3D33|nr:ATP-binding protein [Chamaesiphon sp. VAR_48_metabat_135_sub]